MEEFRDIVSILISLLNATYFLSVIGKAEGEGDLWHSHVSAITVAPEYRRIGLARKLMDMLEIISELVYVVLH